jgi:hypothetical protein
MATLAPRRMAVLPGHGFFFWSAIVMALLNVTAFSFQLAMGRSSFHVSPLIHAHALVFFGWVMIYLAQNVFATTGTLPLHRRLGWIAAFWIPLMVALGIAVTVYLTREGHVPFFFTPAFFLIMNPLEILVFAGLAAAAIMLRRKTQWHRRLIFCAMANIMGPAFGRLLPVPLMIPYATWGIFAGMMLFPLAGIIHDLRTRGRVHPAFLWGTGAIVACQLAIGPIAASSLGDAVYRAATTGSPGAAIAPHAYPPPPWAPRPA